MDLEDDEIKRILDSYGANPNIPINPQTRPLLLSKIAQLQADSTEQEEAGLPSSVQATPESNVAASSPANANSDLKNGFYVLAYDPAACINPDNMQIYPSQMEALKAAKKVSGARFKKCDTPDEARAFVSQQKWGEKDKAGAAANAERPNAYPRLKTPELSEFRKLIEKHEVERWEAAVWDNPYYLITPGDTPAILKPPTHYNALHCATISGCCAICKKLFEILRGDRFWEMVYPSDHSDVRDKRRSHLTDLYLNTSDKLNRETPLHFAAKHGHEDIVAYLLSFKTINSQQVNRYDETAYDLICSKDNRASVDKKQRIHDLFTAPPVFYVPVLRAVDNSVCPSLSAPCTLEQLEVQQPLSDKKESPVVVSSAMAGPMSLQQAKSFHKEWQSPSSSSERKKVKNMKRSDPDRGMERRGRCLAHQQRIPWKESWDFLNCSCDLAGPEGLKILEDYLQKLCTPLDRTPPRNREQNSPTHTEIPVAPTTPVQTQSASISVEELLEDMSRLSLDPSFLTPESVPKDSIFLTGLEPTKLDYDVLLALEDCEIDQSLYPNIINWQALVKTYSEEEQKRWHTPTKQHLDHHLSHTFHSSQQFSPSPLIFSSPKRFSNTAGPQPRQLFLSPSATQGNIA